MLKMKEQGVEGQKTKTEEEEEEEEEERDGIKKGMREQVT